MKGITKNEMKVLLTILKDYSRDYNANNLSRHVGLTPMGALKILKKLEEERILTSRQAGKAVFYRPDYSSAYARKYLAFLLHKEAEEAPARIRRWVNDLKRLDGHAEIGVIFGSVLSKDNYGDVDLLLVLEQPQNESANSRLSELNKVNVKKIHAVKQTENDLRENLKKRDAVILNAVETGVVAFGHEKLVELIGDAARQQ
jgi:DNA-binding Lrp family transcriptional regulator